MDTAVSSLLVRFGLILLALLPWAAALYLHYWLEHSAIWDVSMPFRAFISVIIIASGMGLSLLLHTRLQGLKRR